MACATTACLGAPLASKTVAPSKEPRRPEMVNASPRAPLEAYASSYDVPSPATAVPARGCPPQLFTSALRSEASFFSFSAFDDAVDPLASKTVTSPPLLRRVAVATTLPPTTSSSLASTPSSPSSLSFSSSSFSASSFSASNSPSSVVAGQPPSPSSRCPATPSPRAVISASTRSLTAASSVRPATTCIRSTPRVAVTFAARSSASKYLGNARPDSTSATSSCVPPWMTCASAAYSSSRSRHRGTRASMDAA